MALNSAKGRSLLDQLGKILDPCRQRREYAYKHASGEQHLQGVAVGVPDRRQSSASHMHRGIHAQIGILHRHCGHFDAHPAASIPVREAADPIGVCVCVRMDRQSWWQTRATMILQRLCVACIRLAETDFCQ